MSQASVQEMPPLQQKIILGQVVRFFSERSLASSVIKSASYGGDDALNYFVLNRKDVYKITVVTFSP